MTYTEQLLHQLDDFDTSSGVHVKLVPDRGSDTMLWRITLSGSRPIPTRSAYITFKDDGGGYSWGPTHLSRDVAGLTAEEALTKATEYVLAADAAKRLGREGA